MKAEVLPEPELEFGGTGRHIDIRYGLANYGPFDRTSDTRPSEISLGVVGTQEAAEGLRAWLDACATGVGAKESRLSHLFTSFPGFHADLAYGSVLRSSDALSRLIRTTALKEIAALTSRAEIVECAVALFLEECSTLIENHKVDVLLVAPPGDLFDAMDPPPQQAGGNRGRWVASVEQAEDEPSVPAPAFHDVLKARGMDLGVPIQMVRPETYDATKSRRQRRRPTIARRLQDEATRAWNLHTALYYKAGGTPWRLPRQTTDLSTCFVGVSFYKTAAGDLLMTSMAQVFNELGDGVVVRGTKVKIDKDDRQPHLTREGIAQLIRAALAAYRAEHKTLPARLVVHKTSTFNSAEEAGAKEAANGEKVDWVDLVSLRKSRTRLFRFDRLPPLRGTFVELDENVHLLYTRGSVDFFECYPGLYTPRALEVRSHSIESSPRALAVEIMSLSKMNWNNTQFDGAEPVTTRVARHVGDILRHLPDSGKVQPRYSFYM